MILTIRTTGERKNQIFHLHKTKQVDVHIYIYFISSNSYLESYKYVCEYFHTELREYLSNNVMIQYGCL